MEEVITEVSVPWAEYDAHRLSECKHVLDLRKLFVELDKPIQRREFLLSDLTILLLFIILFGISFKGFASAIKDLGIYHALGMKRALSYKTIQRTMKRLNSKFRLRINQCLVPSRIPLAGIDASGLKTNRKGAWI